MFNSRETILHYYTGLAMQGLCANPNVKMTGEQVVEMAVGMAVVAFAGVEEVEKAFVAEDNGEGEKADD